MTVRGCVAAEQSKFSGLCVGSCFLFWGIWMVKDVKRANSSFQNFCLTCVQAAVWIGQWSACCQWAKRPWKTGRKLARPGTVLCGLFDFHRTLQHRAGMSPKRWRPLWRSMSARAELGVWWCLPLRDCLVCLVWFFPKLFCFFLQVWVPSVVGEDVI